MNMSHHTLLMHNYLMITADAVIGIQACQPSYIKYKIVSRYVLALPIR